MTPVMDELSRSCELLLRYQFEPAGGNYRTGSAELDLVRAAKDQARVEAALRAALTTLPTQVVEVAEETLADASHVRGRPLVLAEDLARFIALLTRLPDLRRATEIAGRAHQRWIAAQVALGQAEYAVFDPLDYRRISPCHPTVEAAAAVLPDYRTQTTEEWAGAFVDAVCLTHDRRVADRCRVCAGTDRLRCEAHGCRHCYPDRPHPAPSAARTP